MRCAARHTFSAEGNEEGLVAGAPWTDIERVLCGEDEGEERRRAPEALAPASREP